LFLSVDPDSPAVVTIVEPEGAEDKSSSIRSCSPIPKISFAESS
jgi:hypothetical protein